jgi:hypothetical protein
MAQIILAEGAAPSTPAANTVAVYVKSDGQLYSKDDVGTEFGPFAVSYASNAEYVTGTETAKVLSPAVARARNLVAGTTVTATSGTSIDFTGLPTWVKRITVNFSGVSTTGTSQILFQLGDSGGIENTGYLSSGVGYSGTTLGTANYTTGFGLNTGGAAYISNGSIVLTLLDATTNTWSAQGQFGYSNGAFFAIVAGSKALSATLDRLRITTVGGAETFDAGIINIIYE